MQIISSPAFEAHVTPPGHPERLERAHVFDAVAARWMERGGNVVPPRPASIEEIARVHGAGYADDIAATEGRAVMLDPDTFTSPESYRVAMLAAGAAVQAAEHAVIEQETAFALVRPPGHHAERDRAMGFCLFNNVAVAAAAMMARGLERIAIVDIDVHHGNGTQQMFYREPRVLYISTHQHPCYPGTGTADELGADDGRGFTVNVPMEPGSADADYDVVYEGIVEPVLEQFRPGLLLISAGYDAHERDPLASMRVTTAGYGRVVGRLARVAKRHGAMALVTEGGYELTALAACLEATIEAVEIPAPSGAAMASGARGERALAHARQHVQPYWKLG